MWLLFSQHSCSMARHPLLETAKWWTGQLADGDETDGAKSSLSIRSPGYALRTAEGAVWVERHQAIMGISM